MTPETDFHARYAGRPLLKFLDAYVLWAMGELPSDQEELLQRLTPSLREMWGRSEESWHEVLAGQLELAPTLPPTIQELWKKGRDFADASGTPLTPMDFAQYFVDQNFAGLFS